jgi:hypothetical protein
MNDHEAAARGDRAKYELELTAEAFEKLHAAMVEELVQTPVGADLKIQRLHMGLQQLAGIRKALLDVVNNGQIARQAIAIHTGLLRPN